MFQGSCHRQRRITTKETDRKKGRRFGDENERHPGQSGLARYFSKREVTFSPEGSEKVSGKNLKKEIAYSGNGDERLRLRAVLSNHRQGSRVKAAKPAKKGTFVFPDGAAPSAVVLNCGTGVGSDVGGCERLFVMYDAKRARTAQEPSALRI